MTRCLNLFLFVLIGVFYFSATYNGNIKTPDSHFYIETAKNLFYNAELKGVESQPLVYWPPLYPAILALGVPYINLYIKILHFISLLSVLFIWQKIALENLYSKTLVNFYSITLCLSTPLLMISVFVWSEIIFLMLFSFYMFFLNKFLKSLQPKWLLMGGLFGFLMLLQRNAGIFFVGGAVIGFGYYYKRISTINKFYLTGHFALVLSGFLVWNILTLWIENDIHIFKALFPEISLKRNFFLNFYEIGLNVFPNLSTCYIQAFLGIALVSVPGILFVKKYPIGNGMAFFYIVFIVYFLTMSMIPANAHDVNRFMSVTFPIVFLLCFYVLDQFLKLKPQYDKYIYGIFGVWLVYPLIRIINNVIYWYERSS